MRHQWLLYVHPCLATCPYLLMVGKYSDQNSESPKIVILGLKIKKNVILAVWDPLRPQIPIIRRYRSIAKLGWTYLRDKICARYNLTPSVIDNSRADSKNSSFWKVLKMALQNGNLESLISPRYCRQRANILRVGCVGAHEGLYYVT